MVIFDKDFVDTMQGLGIAYTHGKIDSLEGRVERLEKLTYELYKIIKDLKSKKDNEIELKEREEQKEKAEREQKYHLNDCVVILKDIEVDGNAVKKGTKGIIDNRLISFGGIKYIIKLDKSKSTIELTESDFEAL